MATDGGKRAERPAERPAESGAEGRSAEGRPADSKRGAKAAAKSPADGQGVRVPYEQARDELTELVKRLEAGGLTLEQSLELWERGERLAAICEEWLEGARAKLAAAMAQRRDSEPASGTPF
jgi:exodeoxyribonuclease VII small subunit